MMLGFATHTRLSPLGELPTKVGGWPGGPPSAGRTTRQQRQHHDLSREFLSLASIDWLHAWSKQSHRFDSGRIGNADV
jgi:hypothetical protein